MKYIIKLNELGYYGKIPWTPSELKDVIVFDSMKDARKALNRLRDRFHYGQAVILPYN